MSGPPPWDPNDTGAIPVGPEPEPTGAAGGGAGSGGWGGKPKVEPFAVAALVWAIVSIVLPLVGTIVALVLSSRAADAIRRSRGTRSGTQIVTAARIIAGAVITLWAIGLVAFVALGGNDDSGGNKVAVPTQPPNTSTTLVPATTTSTTRPPTTTLPPTTTTAGPQPTVITVPPPPTEAPTTQPPTTATAPPTTAPPTTAPPTTAPPTTAPPTTTTTPQQGLQKRLDTRLGPSNRGVPADARVVVQYTPGGTLVVTWAINNGTGTLPTGQPTCTSPPSTTTTTTTPSSSTTTSTTTTTTSTTTTTTPGATTTTVPADAGTRMEARKEARQIFQVIRPDVRSGKLDVTGVQLIGTYPIAGPTTGDVDVVQVLYSKSAIEATLPPTNKVFDAPPATEVQCLNPAFAYYWRSRNRSRISPRSTTSSLCSSSSTSPLALRRFCSSSKARMITNSVAAMIRKLMSAVRKRP